MPSETLRSHGAIHSNWLDGDRAVTVYLPPGYDSSDSRRYPVLYLQDGQNLFDPERSHAKGVYWRVSETADALIAADRIAPLVIVGVDHGEEARVGEFTPTPGGTEGAGRVGAYIQFLVRELMPFIKKTYAVRSDPESTGIGGSSLGGLAALAAAIECPELFGRLLLMSASVWWDKNVIFRRLRAHAVRPGARVWLDVGLQEPPIMIKSARRLSKNLRGAEMKYVEDPEGHHSEDDWARRLPDALEFLFPNST